MKVSNRGLLFAAGLLSSTAIGCVHPTPARPQPPPTTSELVQCLAQGPERLGAVRSEARVDYFEGRGERVKLTMNFLVAYPDRLRIEAESPIGGATLASLATSDGRFQLLDVKHERFLIGPAEPCNIARLIRVELGPRDVVAILLGSAPSLGKPIASRWEPARGGREVLVLENEQQERETIEFGRYDGHLVVRRVELIDAHGALRYRLEHDEIAGSPPLPRRTHIEEPGRKVDLLIRYRDQERDVRLPERGFSLDAPTGITAEPVGCGSEEADGPLAD